MIICIIIINMIIGHNQNRKESQRAKTSLIHRISFISPILCCAVLFCLVLVCHTPHTTTTEDARRSEALRGEKILKNGWQKYSKKTKLELRGGKREGERGELLTR